LAEDYLYLLLSFHVNTKMEQATELKLGHFFS